MDQSLKRGMCWAFCGTHTCLTVSSRLIGQRELTKVSPDHIEFYFDNIVSFSIIDCYKISNHIGHNDAISEMGFYWGWFLTRLGILFSFLAFQIEPVVFVLDL